MPACPPIKLYPASLTVAISADSLKLHPLADAWPGRGNTPAFLLRYLQFGILLDINHRYIQKSIFFSLYIQYQTAISRCLGMRGLLIEHNLTLRTDGKAICYLVCFIRWILDLAVFFNSTQASSVIHFIIVRIHKDKLLK